MLMALQHVAWLPLALVAWVTVLIAPSRLRMTAAWRMALAGLAMLLCVRYGVWRVERMLTVPPLSAVERSWQWVFLIAELGLMAEGMVFLLMLARTRARHLEADAHEAWFEAQRRDASGVLPTVDVFIPTYNEGWDVLSRTLVGALALDYPHLTVHVLDDGARDWLAERCADLGVRYHRRPDRAHAKAGNINYTFRRTDGDLVLVFDADFVAQRNFLRRTVGFFRDETVGIVQVPHHFFNDDPVQANLHIYGSHADDQTFFFQDVMAARDGWGVAFSCGSNSLIRRRALEAIGGIPTSSITEDILTSVALLQRGWHTVYLNERLARGLAPEGLSALYTQRARWARGGIQLLFLKEGPLRAPGLTLLQRLFFLPLSWIASNLFLPVMIAGPVLFLWTGLVAVPAVRGDELLQFQLPMLLATLMAARRLVTSDRSVFLGLAHSVFSTFRLAPVVVHSLIRPFAVGFKVTPKGKLAQGLEVDRRAVTIALGTILALVVGMLLSGLPDFERLPPDAYLTPSLLWGTVTVAVMFVCLLMAFEFRPAREQERFIVNEWHTVHLDGEAQRTRVVDLSASGAAVQWGLDRPAVGTAVQLELSDVGRLDAVVRRHIGEVGVGMAFVAVPEPLERYLLAKLFAHDYDTRSEHASAGAGLRDFLRRLLGGITPASPPAWSLGAIPAESPGRGCRPQLAVAPELAYPRLATPRLRRVA